jgi:hypothetical protein
MPATSSTPGTAWRGRMSSSCNGTGPSGPVADRQPYSPFVTRFVVAGAACISPPIKVSKGSLSR